MMRHECNMFLVKRVFEAQILSLLTFQCVFYWVNEYTHVVSNTCVWLSAYITYMLVCVEIGVDLRNVSAPTFDYRS